MAIAHRASSQAGPQPESHEKPNSPPETSSDTGMELEAALPVATPAAAPGTISRGRRKKQNDLQEPAVDAASDSAIAPLTIAGVDEAESSASHLSGSSAKDIQNVDAKFQ